MINIRKLEAELWTSADLLRQGSKLTSQEYCMPVLGLIFLRYAYSRFKLVEALAEAIASLLRESFGAPWVRVSVAKPGVLRNVRRVGVVIERGER